MEKKYTLILDKEFILYCELNEIKDIDKLANDTFARGFSLLKYGETPVGNVRTKEKIVEVIKEVPIEIIIEKEVKVPYEVQVIKEIIKEIPVEVIREIIKEVPIEIIKEVPVEVFKEGKTKTKTVIKEIIKEVPIEVIKEVIREVQVEKIVEVTKEIVNDVEIKRLTEENEKLKLDLDKITGVLTNMNKGKFMKNSNLSSLYDE
jgi:hypothetical protein